MHLITVLLAVTDLVKRVNNADIRTEGLHMSNTSVITRSMISVGSEVEINPKSDRSRKKLVLGLVSEILTGSESHPHGIMVKLDNGEIGRVKSLSGRVVESVDSVQGEETEGKNLLT